MPKTIFTPRDELVCGKLDLLDRWIGETRNEVKYQQYGIHTRFNFIKIMDLLGEIRHDCGRMEAKLISRKEEVARLSSEIKIIKEVINSYGSSKANYK